MILNQKGQVLVQALVGVVIMGILIASLMSFLSVQTKEMKSIKEQLARSDFQQQMFHAFADGSLCKKILVTATPLTFTVPAGGATTAHPAQLPLTLAAPATIPVSAATGAPALATAGVALSSVADTLEADAPQPFQVSNIVGASNGATGTYSGDFEVAIKTSKLVRSMKPPSIGIILKTSSSGATETITDCAATAPGGPPSHTVYFTTAGTYSFTVPSGVNWIQPEVVGGGGGGAGNAGGTLSGGGGGGGGYARGWLAVTPGQTFSLSVGAKGTAGGAVGNDGGGSSFGGTMTATGGTGGKGVVATSAGGGAGVGSGGQFNAYGSSGGDGNPNALIQGGYGGASVLGGGGRTSTLSHVQSDGLAAGSGGGGAWGATNETGGDGADGAVFISW